MPLNLYPPSKRSKSWRIRGSYCGVRVDRSAKTHRKAVAHKALAKIEQDIERGAFATGLTFGQATVAYLNGGGERRFVRPLAQHFDKIDVRSIDQAMVDQAARLLYPPGISQEPSSHNSTVNRQVHTPIRAILATVGVHLVLKRPKQPPGRTRWLTPDEAGAFVDICKGRLRPLVVFLLYTGCRIGEAISLRWSDVELDEGFAYVRKTKNGDPRGVHLPPVVVVEIANISPKEGRVFGYSSRSHVYPEWHEARQKAKLDNFTPHDLCHTWATWMRRFAGRDERGLIGTGRWRNPRSVTRYLHVVAGEDALAANLLPDVTAGKK